MKFKVSSNKYLICLRISLDLPTHFLKFFFNFSPPIFHTCFKFVLNFPQIPSVFSCKLLRLSIKFLLNISSTFLKFLTNSHANKPYRHPPHSPTNHIRSVRRTIQNYRVLNEKMNTAKESFRVSSVPIRGDKTPAKVLRPFSCSVFREKFSQRKRKLKSKTLMAV